MKKSGKKTGKPQAAPDPEERTLTPKQEAFCQEYLKDLNATQAAIRAGYSEKTARQEASRLLSNVNISSRIQELMDARAKRTEITATYVLKTIHDTVERCRQARPVLDMFGKQVMVETPEGETAPAFTFQAKEVLRGCELLGKHLKLFVERHEHTGKDGAPLGSETDEQLDARLKMLLEKQK